MNSIVLTLNTYLALAGILAVILSCILVFDAVKARVWSQYISRFGLVAAFGVALGSTVMALLYSEVFGFAPCGLCWLERVFLFSQVAILGGALHFRDALVARYGLILSGAGLSVALYHHYVQMGGTAFLKCPVAQSADCAKRIMFEFGFMTFPLLAACGFLLLGALYYYLLEVRVK
jgi:disulfide bond formation protein DsbB